MIKEKSSDIDNYITKFPAAVRSRLEEIRAIIRKSAPEAMEKISYSMPAFYQKGILIYFAAHKNHIGLYPTSSAVKAFEEELKEYKWSKGAIRFPLDQPFPSELISRIVTFRVNENIEKAAVNKNAKGAVKANILSHEIKDRK